MTDRYAVIGNPIGFSKSPMIHGMFAEATGQRMEYTRIEAPIGGFAEAVNAFRTSGGRGVNITAPFKLDAYAYATRRSERAQLAGAANAMKFDGALVYAENFDGVGLVRDVVHNLACPLKGKRILLLGAGGAARGALLPFWSSNLHYWSLPTARLQRRWSWHTSALKTATCTGVTMPA